MGPVTNVDHKRLHAAIEGLVRYAVRGKRRNGFQSSQ